MKKASRANARNADLAGAPPKMATLDDLEVPTVAKPGRAHASNRSSSTRRVSADTGVIGNDMVSLKADIYGKANTLGSAQTRQEDRDPPGPPICLGLRIWRWRNACGTNETRQEHSEKCTILAGEFGPT